MASMSRAVMTLATGGDTDHGFVAIGERELLLVGGGTCDAGNQREAQNKATTRGSATQHGQLLP
jgi:hypothetical protein